MALNTLAPKPYEAYGQSVNYNKMYSPWGSGCGSVGRVVGSNSRGPRFESSHRQKFILNIYCQLYWKDKNKGKIRREWPIIKKCIVHTYETMYLEVSIGKKSWHSLREINIWEYSKVSEWDMIKKLSRDQISELTSWVR